jgi:hypothetical protein
LRSRERVAHRRGRGGTGYRDAVIPDAATAQPLAPTSSGSSYIVPAVNIITGMTDALENLSWEEFITLISAHVFTDEEIAAKVVAVRPMGQEKVAVLQAVSASKAVAQSPEYSGRHSGS